MQVGYPYRVDGSGRTARDAEEIHIRGLIEQVLFTAPGERVNHPDFGTGLMQLVFASGGDETIAATQFLVQGALQQWLGDLIDVESVDIGSEDSTLNITVRYRVLRTQQNYIAEFTS